MAKDSESERGGGARSRGTSAEHSKGDTSSRTESNGNSEKKRSQSSRDRRGSDDRRNDRDRGKTRGSDRTSDRRRDRPKSRSRSPARRRTDQSSDKRRRRRSRSRSGGRRSSRKSAKKRRRSRSREKSKRSEKKKAQANSKEARTIVVSELEVKAGLTDIATFVERVGQVRVRHCKLLTDPITRCSQGVAYVELTNMADVQRALVALNGKEFRYPRGLMAGAVSVKLLLEPSEDCPLHVAGLWADISEAEIRALFEPFGMIDRVTQIGGGSDDSDKSDDDDNFSSVLPQYTKSAILVYHKRAEAELAASMLQDFEVAGNRIRVTLVPADQIKAGAPASTNTTQTAATVSTLSAPPMPATPAAIAPPALAAVSGAVEADAAAAVKTHPIGVPTFCVILKNLFDPNEEEGDTWAGEIQEDIEEECKKFGAVQSCIVDQHSEGFAYVKFVATEDAQKAANSLHGRWFSGKTIEVKYIEETSFDSLVVEVKSRNQ